VLHGIGGAIGRQAPLATEDPTVLAPDGDALCGWVIEIIDTLTRLGFRTIYFKG